MSFAVVACQKLNGVDYDIAHVPLLVMEYLWSPTEWVMADGTAGIRSFIKFWEFSDLWFLGLNILSFGFMVLRINIIF